MADPTIDVEPMVSPDGDVEVVVTIDHGRRWSKPKPVYLTRQAAKQLARELIDAAGGNSMVPVLEQEISTLQRQLEDVLDPVLERELRTCLDWMKLLHRTAQAVGLVNDR